MKKAFERHWPLWLFWGICFLARMEGCEAAPEIILYPFPGGGLWRLLGRFLCPASPALHLAEGGTTTDIYILRELRAIVARLVELGERYGEVSYNALRELRRIERAARRLADRTESRQKARQRERGRKHI